jgi:hypothetical protein
VSSSRTFRRDAGALDPTSRRDAGQLGKELPPTSRAKRKKFARWCSDSYDEHLPYFVSSLQGRILEQRAAIARRGAGSSARSRQRELASKID